MLAVVLSHKGTPSSPDRLAQIEQLAKIASLVALPVVVALGGWWLQRSVAKQAVSKDYVALAVSLLDDSRPVGTELRAWAVDMLNRNAPIPFADSVSTRLKTGELSLPSSLDARMDVIRSGSTNLTQIVAAAMLRAAPDADLAIYNSGAIRIDSLLPISKLSVEAVTRMLPFGNAIVVASLPGHRIEQLLRDNNRRAGSGEFMHTANVKFTDRWTIKDVPIAPLRRYKVATTDFMVRLGALTPGSQDTSDIHLLRTGQLLRDAVIDELLSRVVLRP